METPEKQDSGSGWKNKLLNVLMVLLAPAVGFLGTLTVLKVAQAGESNSLDEGLQSVETAIYVAFAATLATLVLAGRANPVPTKYVLIGETILLLLVFAVVAMTMN